MHIAKSFAIVLLCVGSVSAQSMITKSGGGSSAITSGTTTITGGATTQVCYNQAGVIKCGDSGLTYVEGTDALSAGSVTATGAITSGTGSANGVILESGNAMKIWRSSPNVNMNFQGDYGSANVLLSINSNGPISMLQGGSFGWTSADTSDTTLVTFFNRPEAGSVKLTGDHFGVSGTAPAVSACGSSPSVVTGNDTHGKLTTGSGGTLQSCTITFNNTYLTAPSCRCNDETAIKLVRAVSTTTTLVCDAAVAGDLTSSVLSYICLGN